MEEGDAGDSNQGVNPQFKMVDRRSFRWAFRTPRIRCRFAVTI